MAGYEIDVVVSKKDKLACFAGYFSDNDVLKMKAFAESLNCTVNMIEHDGSFRDELNPYRVVQTRDINWHNPQNIIKVYKLALDGKSDYQIVKALGSEGDGFSITIKRGQIMTEFKMYERLEGQVLSDTLIEKYALLIANHFISTDSVITRRIARLKKNGCVVGTSTYPECLKGFNKECFNCPHNDNAGKLIKTETDILRFNEIWHKPEVK